MTQPKGVDGKPIGRDPINWRLVRHLLLSLGLLAFGYYVGHTAALAPASRALETAASHRAAFETVHAQLVRVSAIVLAQDSALHARIAREVPVFREAEGGRP